MKKYYHCWDSWVPQDKNQGEPPEKFPDTFLTYARAQGRQHRGEEGPLALFRCFYKLEAEQTCEMVSFWGVRGETQLVEFCLSVYKKQVLRRKIRLFS